MIMESIAILSVTLCMAVIFLRRKEGSYALRVLPLLIVPGAHLIFYPVFTFVRGFVKGLNRPICLAFTDIAALAVTCLLIFIFSKYIHSSKNKKLYIALLGGYSVVLTCAYVYQTLQPLFS